MQLMLVEVRLKDRYYRCPSYLGNQSIVTDRFVRPRIRFSQLLGCISIRAKSIDPKPSFSVTHVESGSFNVTRQHCLM